MRWMRKGEKAAGNFSFVQENKGRKKHGRTRAVLWKTPHLLEQLGVGELSPSLHEGDPKTITDGRHSVVYYILFVP